MRHRKDRSKLGRTSSHRDAMLRNMVTSLLKYDRIHTTDARAKELRRWADHVITLAKRGDLHARRQAMAIVREKTVVHKLFAEAGQRFGSRSGGYTRLVKIGPRPGDAAAMSLVELVSVGDASGKKSKGKKAAKKATPAPAVPVETSPVAAQTEAAPAAGTLSVSADDGNAASLEADAVQAAGDDTGPAAPAEAAAEEGEEPAVDAGGAAADAPEPTEDGPEKS